MTYIHVPLDYSELKSAIPPGEDILLSSKCKALIDSVGGTTKFTSHVLLTQKHFAFTFPVKNKPVELNLVPLYKVVTFNRGGIIMKKIPIASFRFKWEGSYETNANFKERVKKFGYNFLPYLIEAKKERIKVMEANPEAIKKKDINKMKKQLIKIEQSYEKAKTKFG